MNPAAALLTRLRKLGVELLVEGDKLKLRAAKGVLTPELRDELARHKAEILALVAEATGSGASSAPPLSRRSVDAEPELSFAQQRLWFLDQLHPGDCGYNMELSFRLRGELDGEALEASLTELVRRHETLRTAFCDEGGVPKLVVQEALPLVVEEVDLTGLPAEEREAAARAAAQRDVRTPFDLAAGRLFRAQLLHLGPGDHVLLLTLHHIVSDGWSLKLVQEELGALYSAAVEGRPAELPELPVGYTDFAAWQRAWLDGSVWDEQLAYWKQQLAGLEPLALATDRPRPPVQTYDAAWVELLLPATLTGAVERLGREQEASLSMTLHAAFSVLLGRTTGQEEVVLGTLIANRGRAELEPLIGFFVNSLVVRADLSGDPTLREAISRVRSTSLEAYAHQDLPFEQLVKELVTDRDLSRNPLYQVLLSVHGETPTTLELRGLDVERFERGVLATHTDVALHVFRAGAGLRCVFFYSADLFERATIERLGGRFRRLLEEGVARPDAHLSELGRLSSEERAEVVERWNDTAREFPGDLFLIDRFEQVVARAPDAPALSFEETRLTYRELDERANRLAQVLCEEGVGPERIVALGLERSVELVVSLLAVQKAGGAWLPLDPEYPDERLALVLEDSGAALLLTTPDLAQRLGERAGPMLVLGAATLEARLAAASTEPPPRALDPEQLAYVIFTSGSTGRPKGVMNAQCGIANRLAWMRAEHPLAAGERVLQKTPYTFDVSIWEFFWPLTSGAELVLARPGGHRDPEYLLELVASRGVTAMHFVPSMLRAFLALPDLAPAQGVRRVYCSGEALTADLRDTFFERFPGAELHNLYGPTEAAIEVTALACRPEDRGTPVTIGRPVPNTTTYVLDGRLEPVPVGVTGELYLGGVQVARGYLDRPELTAESFVPDPFRSGERGGGRLYRTGDLARWRADGTIEYLGRTDHQVKLRGYRIELGEIEAALAGHPDVQAAAVVTSGEGTGTDLLVGYVVARAGAELDPVELQAFLGERLPAYMVPDVLMPLEAVPLNVSGKLDRRALPAPRVERRAASEYVAPRTEVERELAALWHELLPAERIGVHDGFFELGGHSLLATQLVARLRATFAIELPLTALFGAPTIAALSARIEAARAAGGRTAGTPAAATASIEPVPRDGRPLPLSFAEQRLWFLDQMGSGAGYNMPGAFRLRGVLDVPALERSLLTIAERHEVLRTAFPTRDGRPRVAISSEARLPLRRLVRRGLAPEERGRVIAELAGDEGHAPFDLACSPLARVVLIELADDDHVLLVTLHHVIADGWSLSVFARELAACYGALAAGREPELDPLPIQYADFAAWQRGWLEGETFERQLAYWTEELRDLPLLALPTDRSRPPVPSHAGAALDFELPPELFARVRELCVRAGATPAMFLLAAFQALLGRYTGQDDVVVGSPIANRVHPDLENLIGFFVNTLVLRADLSGDPDFEELLSRVRKTSLAAYDHQDLPFERLVDELEPDRDPSRNPLFQVAFMFQNMPRVDVALPGLVIEEAPLDLRAVRVDLEFHLFEEAGGIHGRVFFATDLFERETAERLARHYRRLVESAVEAPRARLSELSLLAPEERGRLAREWNRTAVPFDDGRCIHELIEECAREAPGHRAVEFEDVRLTYGELNARANRVAHVLRERGVGPDTLVGLAVDRSPELAVGLLGILKAGGAYVPLDPTYPEERLAYMLADSGIGFLLTKASLAGDLPPHGAAVLHLDGSDFDGASDADPPLVTGADDLAYVIYTSGSTGRPKGTLLAHRGLVNLAAEQARLFGVDAGTRALHFSSLSFDASTFDVMMALPRGATLVMGDRQSLLPGPDLHRFLFEHAVSIVTLPPTALATLPTEPLPDLVTITVAGEACSAELVNRWAPGRRFFNLYGPTEATIWSTVAELRPGEASHIGHPIGNVTAHVVDGGGGLVPVGVAGELALGGVGLARGYLGRPELTAERFVPDPFADEPGERLYRTGDLVRRRPDGALEFLGRIDDQIKLRGYRIELGEIEGVLDEHPAVLESAVTVYTSRDEEDRRLVAYVRCDESVELVDEKADASAWSDDHVDQWRTVYDQTYSEVGEPAEVAFQISGWNSSYTGEPLPAAEMRVWVDETAAALRKLRARRVLEMGCGSGLVLLNLVRDVEQYHGSDFSQPALDSIATQLSSLAGQASKVTLDARTADDFEGLPTGHFDTVVLNSVVQYFPDEAYLARVLTRALEHVAPGGRVFVGDVRSLPLATAFHASVQLERAPAGTSREQLEQRVRHESLQDQELLVDPAFFTRLSDELGTLAYVELHPKPGRYDNELSRFRYDVVLHRGAPAAPADLSWTPWSADEHGLSALRRRLSGEARATVALTGVRNARVARDAALVDSLAGRPGDGQGDTAADLALAVAVRTAESPGLDPEDLRELGAELGYDVHLSLSSGRADGGFDALFVPCGPDDPSAPDAQGTAALWNAVPRHTDLPPGAPLTNRPLRGRFLRELVPHLRRFAADRLPEYMVPAVFTVLDAFPLSPSGKVDRRALPAPDALRPELAVEYEAPRSALEETLAGIWMRVLGVDRVGSRDDFFELGGDSMLSIQVVSAAREAGIAISARDLFEHHTVAELAAAAGRSVATAEQGPVTGEVGPTPISAWFFAQELTDRHHFNQAFLLEFDGPVATAELEPALAALLAHHDALRLRAHRDGTPGESGGWRTELAPPGGPVPLEVLDLSSVPPDRRDAHLEAEAARVQASLDLSRGPLMRCALFRSHGADGGGGDRLLVAIHHLAVDVVSWGVLLDDLARGLEQRRAGEPVRLPPKTTSLREWSRRLFERAADAEVERQARTFTGRPWAKSRALPLVAAGGLVGVRGLGGANTVGSLQTVSCELDEAATRAIQQEVLPAFHATVEDLLLAALAMALAAATGSDHVRFDREGHGREEFAEDLDLSRTVGWFTALHPLLLEVPGAGPGDVLRSVKEQVRAVPDRGFAFGLARALSPDAALRAELAGLPDPEVVFNYLGQLDRTVARRGPFRASAEGVGPSRSPRGERTHALEVSAALLAGRLHVNFDWSPDVLDGELVERLAEDTRAALFGFVEAARTGSGTGFTESDLAEVGWSAEDVEELLMDED